MDKKPKSRLGYTFTFILNPASNEDAEEKEQIVKDHIATFRNALAMDGILVEVKE